LDDLVKNLLNDGVDHFKYMRRTFGDGDPNIFEQGLYLYEYMTGRDVFQQTSLPSMSAFYSKLKMEGITADEYKRAQEFGLHTNAKICKIFTVFTSSLVSFYWLIVCKNFRGVGTVQCG